MSATQVERNDDEQRIVRVLGDPTSQRGRQVHVPPDTTVPTQADGEIEVVPILPGSAYDRGPSVDA